MPEDLSSHESAIYDRQIRLWGSSAQMRIKQGTALFVGVSGTTAEMCKNILLAGANLVIADDRHVTADTTNFLITLELDIQEIASLTVGQATAKAVSQLNEHPSVKTISLEEVVKTIPSIDSVIVSLPLIDAETALSLSKTCRQLNKSFFVVFDSLAANWCFCDMGETHVVESHTAPLRRDERTGERSADKRVIEYIFSSFADFVNSLTVIEPNIANSKPYFPLAEIVFVRLYLEYTLLEAKEEPSPKRTRLSSSNSNSFREFVIRRVDDFGNLEGKVGKVFSSVKELIVDQLVRKYEDQLHLASLPHMAAIHGALVAQEVVKYITKRDIPLVNQIVVNPNDCGCIVIKTPNNLSSRVISDENEKEDEVEVVAGANTLD
jgi:molybdopterin/thiamine biosynthesis adenylyltransferase